MKRLALALAVMTLFAAGCDDKDKASASKAQAAAAAEAASKRQAKADSVAGSLVKYAESSGAGFSAGGDPGRRQFDGDVLGYAEPGAVSAGPYRSYGARPPLRYTSMTSSIPRDLDLAAPPTPYTGGSEQFSGLRDALVRRGSDARVVDESIAQSLRKGMDPLMVLAIGSQESGLRSRVTSPVGAAGAMQLMPATACGLGVCNTAALYNPTINVGLGTTYFQQMVDKFGFGTAAIAAYNAGPGAVEKYGGVPPYAETQNYVRRVVGYYQQFKQFVSQEVSA